MTPQQDAPGYHALWVQLSQWGDSWSGNQFTLNLASGLETPKDSLWTGERPLERLSLDDTAAGLELEREIVARIPHPAPDHWLHDELAKPGPEGDFWRSAYQRAFTVNESPWNPGKDIWLRYFSVQDVEAWADYLLPRLAYLLGDVPERGSSAA